MSATTNVQISVRRNIYQPRFTNDTYFISLAVNAAVDKVLLQLIAVDADNVRIVLYSLT